MATLKNKDERNFRLVSNTEAGKTDSGSLQFNKIKVGSKTLANDVMLDIDAAAKMKSGAGSRRPIKKEDVERALREGNVAAIRHYSRTFFRTSGIYSRLCRYMAYLYRYDTFITPISSDVSIFDETAALNNKTMIKGWFAASAFLENCKLRKEFGSIALKVIVDGCYYGYKVEQKSATFLQELPASYCRSRYSLNGVPAIEFNVKYFDDAFSDTTYRVKVLKLWPKEIQKAYLAYKNGNLPKDFSGDDNGWVLLDTTKTVKFNLSGDDAPLFATVIPKLLDLADAQDLDRKKMLQQILKIIIQTMPLDKNGDLIFDVQEAQQLHNNAVMMLGDAVGVDVLTTFADVKVEDMADNSTVSSVDQLDKVERTVYNEAGTGKNLFNAEGNLALEKSILNDEGTMLCLIQQFEEYAEGLLSTFNKGRGKLRYKVRILPTTMYNYKDLAKSYKELTSLGFSKLLPQVALGSSQSEVIMTAFFENKALGLNDLFIPPQSSNTMSGSQSTSDAEVGRPELDDDQKSDKTIQNKESE